MFCFAYLHWVALSTSTCLVGSLGSIDWSGTLIVSPLVLLDWYNVKKELLLSWLISQSHSRVCSQVQYEIVWKHNGQVEMFVILHSLLAVDPHTQIVFRSFTLHLSPITTHNKPSELSFAYAFQQWRIKSSIKPMVRLLHWEDEREILTFSNTRERAFPSISFLVKVTTRPSIPSLS